MLELECLGACANAPMMSVGDVYYVWILELYYVYNIQIIDDYYFK